MNTIVESLPAEQAKRIRKLENALMDIMDWKLPVTGEFWPSGNPVSYEAYHGSQGAKDYIREIARRALELTP